MKGDHRAGVCDVLNPHQSLHTDVLNHALHNKQRNFISCSYSPLSKLHTEVLLGRRRRRPLGKKHIAVNLFPTAGAQTFRPTLQNRVECKSNNH